MPSSLVSHRSLPLLLLCLVGLQVACAVFFFSDVVSDYLEDSTAAASRLHLYVETAAAVSLFAAIAVEARLLVWLLRRKAHLEQAASVASQALHDVIEAHCDRWRLTPAERDITLFLVKGLSIAEIAQARGNAEGTVKSHLNAIYRKSGTSGRGDLLSLLIDGLLTPVDPPG